MAVRFFCVSGVSAVMENCSHSFKNRTKIKLQGGEVGIPVEVLRSIKCGDSKEIRHRSHRRELKIWSLSSLSLHIVR